MAYLAGTIKIGYIGGLIDKSQAGISRALYSLIYHALPNLECFNLKTSLVHHDAVPAAQRIERLRYVSGGKQSRGAGLHVLIDDDAGLGLHVALGEKAEVRPRAGAHDQKVGRLGQWRRRVGGGAVDRRTRVGGGDVGRRTRGPQAGHEATVGRLDRVEGHPQQEPVTLLAKVPLDQRAAVRQDDEGQDGGFLFDDADVEPGVVQGSGDLEPGKRRAQDQGSGPATCGGGTGHRRRRGLF